MTLHLPRRDFLRSVGSTAALACGCGLLGRPAAAIEPIHRTGKAKFKFSLAAYSYRELLAGKQKSLELADFIRDCAAMQLEGTELTSYYFPEDVTPDYLRATKRLAFELGLDITGTSVANDFCYPAGEEREKQLEHVRKWADNAAILGAPVIRIFSGKARKGQDPKEAHRLAVDGIEAACEYAGKQGVMLALENHGGLTTEVDGLLALVRDVKSPWFGVNLDTGNFRSADPYADLAKVAPYAVNVQVKVAMQPAGAAKEPAQFDRLARILSEAGYRGYIVLEFEEKEDPRTACPRYISQLRSAFAGV